MWRRLVVLATALAISAPVGIAVAAAPARAASPPPGCRAYIDPDPPKATAAYACADVVHFSGGVDGSGEIECLAGVYHATYCRAQIVRLRLYVNDGLWREVTNIGGDTYNAAYKIRYYCWGVRLKFQVWMTYKFTWYNEFGQVHYIDNYQSPLTSYPEYSC